MFMIKQIKGVTLLEILIAIAIIGLVMIFVMPSYQALITRIQEKNSILQLVKAIQLARQEAIVRGEVVQLCKSTDLKNCGGSWEEGYIILAGDKLIYAFQKTANRRQGSIVWRARLGQDELEFLPTGFTKAENGSFLYCEKKQENPKWLIVLNKSGKARVVMGGKPDEIVDSNGRRIEC